MNFAEAAMLIQGSVCVYSKKVCITSFACTVYQIFSFDASKSNQMMTLYDFKRNMLINLK